MPGLRDKLTDAAYGLGWSVVCRAPESWARWAFRTAGDIAWRRQGPRVQVLEGNLRRVLGPAATGKELRALSREAMRSYARYWMEVFRLPVIPAARLVAGMEVEGSVQIAFDYTAAGRGVVFALPHMGNWDQAGAWIIDSGAGSFTTVAERVKPESVYERFVGFREALGMEVLPASGGSRPFGLLARRLREGRIVCLPCDRDVTGSGIEVEFFGEKARMMAGPAALALQTGAALIPATLWFTDSGWGVRFHEEIPAPANGDSKKQQTAAMTQQIARAFEDGITAHPADWHMLQRVFVADLDPVRLAAADAAAGAAGAGAAGAAAG
ncbi:MAG: phosphatidylinositol mannoside acyltransferase [Streptosporangiaceae bacterium]|jgi:KDO2-lipid IV(A) lauroyltransferase